MKNMLFQSLHSAPGANASFALGYRNHGGGFGIEIDRVPDQDVYILSLIHILLWKLWI